MIKPRGVATARTYRGGAGRESRAWHGGDGTVAATGFSIAATEISKPGIENPKPGIENPKPGVITATAGGSSLFPRSHRRGQGIAAATREKCPE